MSDAHEATRAIEAVERARRRFEVLERKIAGVPAALISTTAARLLVAPEYRRAPRPAPPPARSYKKRGGGRPRIIKDRAHFERILRAVCDDLHDVPKQRDVSGWLGIYVDATTRHSTVERAATRHFGGWDGVQAFCRDYLAGT